MKRIQKRLLLIALFLSAFLWKGEVSEAAEMNPNKDLTVVADINVLFREDGTCSASEFVVKNQTLVPVTVKKVRVTAHNGWELVSDTTTILADTKQLMFQLDGQCLYAGDNAVNFTVADHAEATWGIQIGRGAWTTAVPSQQAVHLELEWEYGTKEFQLYLDGNGSSDVLSPMKVVNGETITLPILKREGYQFAGWQDEKGNVYNGAYTMPIGDTSLTALWKEFVAYAIYSASDNSFRFVQSADVIRAGDLYNGRRVTSVYTGFEKNVYTTYAMVPWYADQTNQKVTKVVVEDVIKPVSMQNWFYYFEYCSQFELANIDTSKVTSMYNSFRHAGFHCKGTVRMTGLDNWDVSKVTDFSYMFDAAGRFATVFDIGNLGGWDVSSATTLVRMFSTSGYQATTYRIGDLSKWNTSNVTRLSVMFKDAGVKANWSLNCQKWNVRKVELYVDFNANVENKVIPPKWVT